MTVRQSGETTRPRNPRYKSVLSLPEEDTTVKDRGGRFLIESKEEEEENWDEMTWSPSV